MKVFTQKEYDNFPIENGIRICPTGDYTQIKKFYGSSSFGSYSNFGSDSNFGNSSNFGNGSRFGSDSSFGINSSFENGAGIGNRILQIAEGSENRTSTAFDLDTGVFVRSGCFFGTIDEFKEKVIETHGDNIHAKTYLLWIQIIELNFGVEKLKEGKK